MTTTIQTRDLTKQAPHSPRDRIGGFAIAARAVDKCRSATAGTPGEYHFDCPLDNVLFTFKGITGEQFKTVVGTAKNYEEVGVWLQANGTTKKANEIKDWSDTVEASSMMNNPEKREFFATDCKRLGINPKTSTTFDWLEADDRASFAPVSAGCQSKHNSVVAIYKSHAGAEAAVKELQQAGFPMKNLSIVGRDYHTDEHVVGYYNAEDRMKSWGKNGAFWGGIWGMLFGSAFFFIPGIGPLMIAGPLVSWMVGALEGAVIVGGLSALGAGLYSLGIPKDSILQYETAIKTDKFILIAHGSDKEVAQAKEVIARSGAESCEEHPASGAAGANSSCECKSA